MTGNDLLKQIPSVDKLLTHEDLADVLEKFGRRRTTRIVQHYLAELREAVQTKSRKDIPPAGNIIADIALRLEADETVSPKRVINLTGTILHTNLGRASLPTSVMETVTAIATGASNLEFDLDTGARGDRDSHVEHLITELTGAEAATVVNNNAAAVLLCLNTLAEGKGVCVSRGELVEIGGSFRIPEVMTKSGCTLIEVGATNRTHLRDYENAIDDNTALLMKVHTSNYEIKGFTSDVGYEELAALSKSRSLPFLADLGSGTLINLEEIGLEHEPTVTEVLKAGVDAVTFSGDKLLGGPQAGIIAGSKSVIAAVKKNPLKRALRVDKMTVSALSEVLKLYRNPDVLLESLPTIKFLARSPSVIDEMASRLLPSFQQSVGAAATARAVPAFSQIGSGALPLDTLPSTAIEISPARSGERELQRIFTAFRQLPTPVIGRLQDGRILFDVRTVDDPGELKQQLESLSLE